MMRCILANKKEHYEDAVALFREYADLLGIDLGFQYFEKELKEASLVYAAPRGCIILYYDQSLAIGCVAVRPIDSDIAELKRMYVKPAYQRRGLGQALLTAAVDFATRARYHKIQLDTLANMTPAMELYQKNGFYPIPAYYFNPEKEAVYFEKKLELFLG